MIGVYVARDKAGSVLYVGSSGCITTRLEDHRRSSCWWSEVSSIEQIETESRTLAYYRERELIKELSPRHNLMSKGSAKIKSRGLGPAVRPRAEAFAVAIEAYGTVAALAAALGINHQTLSDVWRGVHYPSSTLIARMIVVTGVPFDELFYIEPSDVPPSEWLAKKKPAPSASVTAA